MGSEAKEMKKIVRELRGKLSRAKLAEIFGVSQQAIAQYELGRFPKPETLEKLAKATGKKIKWIIEDMEEEND